MLCGNGMTWEIIITVPYSQGVVNVEHLTIAFFVHVSLSVVPLKLDLQSET